MELIRNHTTLPSETEVTFYLDGLLVDPEAVLFTVLDLTSSPPDEIPVGIPNQPAIRLSAGKYYARFTVPEKAAFGEYKIVFNYALRDSGGNIQSLAIPMPFTVVSEVPQPTSPAALDLIDKLRKILRDNNPDAYYRFAPPLRTGEIKGFTKRTGYIWQDDELNTFLAIATDELRATPFGTSVEQYPNISGRFQPAVLMTAAFYALYSEAIRWASEEFNYDIDGVSLSIDRSSKFQSMADAVRQAAQTQLEFLAKTIRYTRGVKMTTSVSRGAVLGPSIAHSPITNFIQGKYKV